MKCMRWIRGIAFGGKVVKWSRGALAQGGQVGKVVKGRPCTLCTGRGAGGMERIPKSAIRFCDALSERTRRPGFR